jgi:hypothetical protein
MAGERHEASGTVLARKVIRPDIADGGSVLTVIDSADIRTEWDKVKGELADTRQPVRLNDAGASFNGGAIIGRRSANVCLAPWAIDKLKGAAMGDLSFSIHVVDHDNGWSLIIAEYDRIIGSLWLAYVRTDTLKAS